jgi:hypothetical protein
MNDGYTGRTLLSIVQGCMGSSRHNTGSSTWTAGLCRNVGTRTSSSGSFGSVALSSVLRIGVGDGQSNSGDWALLMPLIGNAKGDYWGYNAWAFGGEDKTNNGHSGTVTISTCPGALFHSLKVDTILVLGGYLFERFQHQNLNLYIVPTTTTTTIAKTTTYDPIDDTDTPDQERTASRTVMTHQSLSHILFCLGLLSLFC